MKINTETNLTIVGKSITIQSNQDGERELSIPKRCDPIKIISYLQEEGILEEHSKKEVNSTFKDIINQF